MSFYGHEIRGAEIVRRVGQNVKLKTADLEWLVEAVRQHMRLMALDQGMSDAALRRLARDLQAGITLHHLLEIRRADKAGSGIPEKTLSAARIEEPRARFDALWGDHDTAAAGPPRFTVNGRDVMAALGIRPGPAVGEALERLMEVVDKDPSLNTRERLIEFL